MYEKKPGNIVQCVLSGWSGKKRYDKKGTIATITGVGEISNVAHAAHELP